MFDLKLQVRLKQAQNALKDGRLDEAFAIATEQAIRSLRGGQLLLEDLVDPLLDRASAHFAGGRLREAILDVERAIQAGGNRPRAAQLRKDAREALDAKDSEGRRERQAIESARAHLRNGSLRTGLEALAEASPDSPEAARFRREVESRERKGEEARARVRAHIEHGETVEALSALEEAVRACPRHEEMPELRASVKKKAIEAIERAFGEGDLEGARGALARLRIVAEEGLEMRRLAEALELA
ncbi:MAG TPA: hypothetical protein VMT52_11470, partial [Planctomycetota bacterium]|nr:hypothetical protein [Planctomycetota bacterium]